MKFFSKFHNKLFPFMLFMIIHHLNNEFFNFYWIFDVYFMRTTKKIYSIFFDTLLFWIFIFFLYFYEFLLFFKFMCCSIDEYWCWNIRLIVYGSIDLIFKTSLALSLSAHLFTHTSAYKLNTLYCPCRNNSFIVRKESMEIQEEKKHALTQMPEIIISTTFILDMFYKQCKRICEYLKK